MATARQPVGPNKALVCAADALAFLGEDAPAIVELWRSREPPLPREASETRRLERVNRSKALQKLEKQVKAASTTALRLESELTSLAAALGPSEKAAAEWSAAISKPREWFEQLARAPHAAELLLPASRTAASMAAPTGRELEDMCRLEDREFCGIPRKAPPLDAIHELVMALGSYIAQGPPGGRTKKPKAKRMATGLMGSRGDMSLACFILRMGERGRRVSAKTLVAVELATSTRRLSEDDYCRKLREWERPLRNANALAKKIEKFGGSATS